MTGQSSPSPDTGTTRWHMHPVLNGLTVAWPNDACTNRNCDLAPVLVLPLDGLREQIARTLGEHEEAGWEAMDRFECTCGAFATIAPIDGSVVPEAAVAWLNAHVADALLAGFAAGQETT